jgi:hypothetical protein
MISLLTNVLPILGGFLMKLLAIRSQQAADNTKQMMDVFAARSQSLESAREQSNKESPMAALNRRVIIFVILALVVFTQTAPVFFNVPTVIPTIIEGFSFLGFEVTPDRVEYITVQGMLKLTEVFEWATLIIEFYFGAQLAKGR